MAAGGAEAAALTMGGGVFNNVDAESLQLLSSMGFSRHWCELALQLCDGDVDIAAAWIVDNIEALQGLMEDPSDSHATSAALPPTGTAVHGAVGAAAYAAAGSGDSGYMQPHTARTAHSTVGSPGHLSSSLKRSLRLRREGPSALVRFTADVPGGPRRLRVRLGGTDVPLAVLADAAAHPMRLAGILASALWTDESTPPSDSSAALTRASASGAAASAAGEWAGSSLTIAPALLTTGTEASEEDYWASDAVLLSWTESGGPGWRRPAREPTVNAATAPSWGSHLLAAAAGLDTSSAAGEDNACLMPLLDADRDGLVGCRYDGAVLPGTLLLHSHSAGSCLPEPPLDLAAHAEADDTACADDRMPDATDTAAAGFSGLRVCFPAAHSVEAAIGLSAASGALKAAGADRDSVPSAVHWALKFARALAAALSAEASSDQQSDGNGTSASASASANDSRRFGFTIRSAVSGAVLRTVTYAAPGPGPILTGDEDDGTGSVGGDDVECEGAAADVCADASAPASSTSAESDLVRRIPFGFGITDAWHPSPAHTGAGGDSTSSLVLAALTRAVLTRLLVADPAQLHASDLVAAAVAAANVSAVLTARAVLPMLLSTASAIGNWHAPAAIDAMAPLASRGSMLTVARPLRSSEYANARFLQLAQQVLFGGRSMPSQGSVLATGIAEAAQMTAWSDAAVLAAYPASCTQAAAATALVTSSTAVSSNGSSLAFTASRVAHASGQGVLSGPPESTALRAAIDAAAVARMVACARSGGSAAGSFARLLVTAAAAQLNAVSASPSLDKELWGRRSAWESFPHARSIRKTSPSAFRSQVGDVSSEPSVEAALWCCNIVASALSAVSLGSAEHAAICSALVGDAALVSSLIHAVVRSPNLPLRAAAAVILAWVVRTALASLRRAAASDSYKLSSPAWCAESSTAQMMLAGELHLRCVLRALMVQEKESGRMYYSQHCTQILDALLAVMDFRAEAAAAAAVSSRCIAPIATSVTLAPATTSPATVVTAQAKVNVGLVDLDANSARLELAYDAEATSGADADAAARGGFVWELQLRLAPPPGQADRPAASAGRSQGATATVDAGVDMTASASVDAPTLAGIVGAGDAVSLWHTPIAQLHQGWVTVYRTPPFAGPAQRSACIHVALSELFASSPYLARARCCRLLSAPEPSAFTWSAWSAPFGFLTLPGSSLSWDSRAVGPGVVLSSASASAIAGAAGTSYSRAGNTEKAAELKVAVSGQPLSIGDCLVDPASIASAGAHPSSALVRDGCHGQSGLLPASCTVSYVGCDSWALVLASSGFTVRAV